MPKSANGYRLGIINPITLVGNEIKTILRDRAFPFDRIALLDSTGEVAGALTDIGDEPAVVSPRSEEHTSELQSRQYLVCRLLLEKKKTETYHPLSQQQELNTALHV